MSLTKQGIHKLKIKIDGLEPTNDNVGYINLLLYNLVLKGIVAYDLLTLSEKKSINLILSGEHTNYYYDQRIKHIRHRNRKKEEVQDK